jgi:UDP-N-acetylmuramate dehydrogenase
VIVHGADLTSFNTLGVKVQANCFVDVKSLDDLQKALQWRKQQTLDVDQFLPIMALGGGSNIVLRNDFPGMVIKVDIQYREVIEEDDDFVWLRVGAGENWHQFVEYCMSFHYWGLENLALIPGSVGAAPIQNIGAYGVEVGDFLAEVSAVEIRSGVSVCFDKVACQLGYRDSVFKKKFKDKYIITSVTFKLRKSPATKVTYPALLQNFQNKGIVDPTPQQVFDTVCEVRRSKLPDPNDIPNVGSFFKNPVVTNSHYQTLKLQHKNIVGYVQNDGDVKLAAGWLIEQAGWKGFIDGPVGVHHKQALVIVNHDNGSGEQVLNLAEKIQHDIKQKYDVELEVEPRIYGVSE